LSAVVEIAQHDPQQIPSLYEAIRQPLAMQMAEEQRLAALLMLGQGLGPRELAAALAQCEPYPNWTGSVLEARVEVYERTGSPHLARARRELAEFRRNTPETMILKP